VQFKWLEVRGNAYVSTVCGFFVKNGKNGLIARRSVVQIHPPLPKITKGLRITSKPFFLVHTQKIQGRIRSDAQIAVLYVISGYSEGIPPVYHQ
jgi:hypothetical protein